MADDTLSLLFEVSHKLTNAEREIDELKTEAKRREEIWLGRLQEADNRTERIWRLKVDPPILIVDKDVFSGRLSMEPGTIVSDEWSKIRRSVIEAEDIYFRDFLRSFWKRLRGRRSL